MFAVIFPVTDMCSRHTVKRYVRKGDAMPQIRIEYSKNIAEKLDIQAMTQAAHDALVGEGIAAAQTKARAIALDACVAGELGADGYMVHISFHLLTGRDVTLRNQYSGAIHAAVKGFMDQLGAAYKLTLEVTEMDRETYRA